MGPRSTPRALIAIGGAVESEFLHRALDQWVSANGNPRAVIVADASGLDEQTRGWAELRGYPVQVACDGGADPAEVAACKVILARRGDHVLAFPGVELVRRGGDVVLLFPAQGRVPGWAAVPIRPGVLAGEVGPGWWQTFAGCR